MSRQFVMAREAGLRNIAPGRTREEKRNLMKGYLKAEKNLRSELIYCEPKVLGEKNTGDEKQTRDRLVNEVSEK